VLKKAYRIIFRSGERLAEAIARARRELPASPQLGHFLAFLENSERGICRPRGADE
jgi:UDP-N-acetylglucosamine acyltransferase